MSEYLFDKLSILNNVYNNNIQNNKVSQENILNIEPTIIKTKLLPHQIELVKAMYNYRNRMIRGFISNSHIINGKIGIIGDPCGTGKTLSILTYLVQNYNYPKMTNELVINSNKYFFSHKLEEINDLRKSNLIIVPHSLFSSWKNEISKHTNINYIPIETKRIIKGNDLVNNIINSSFVLTTSKCFKYVNEFAINNNIYWDNIFIDEAAHIYISPSDPMLKFQFLWLITSDWVPLLFKYTNINKNDLYFLKDRLELNCELEEWLTDNNPLNKDNHIVSSAYFKEYLPYNHKSRGYLVIRNSKSFINESINLPHINRNIIKCKPNITLQSIIAYLNKEIKERKENTIEYLLDKNVCNIFQSLNINFYDFTSYLWKQPVYKHALIKRKYEEQECVICLEKPSYTTIVKCCYNTYCGKCLLRNMLINHKCPTCRSELILNDIGCIETLSDTVKIHGKTKKEICIDNIEANPNGKYIIFTMFDNIYYQMYQTFLEKGITVERIENNLFSMIKTLNNFNKGNTRVLFISNPSLIKGISLSQTTHLIFYHEPPFFEMSDVLVHSAQRIGREKELQIIHLNSELEF